MNPAPPIFSGLPNIPAIRELQSRPQWVAWKYVVKHGRSKPTKPPVSPITGHGASHSNPETWATFEVADAHARKHALPGVGYVLSDFDNKTGIDLDNCRDPGTGALDLWAAQVVKFAETYTEVSPSGMGLRFICEGKIAETVKCDPASVEIYRSQRYLTITGNHVAGTPDTIGPAPRTIAALMERVERYRPKEAAPDEGLFAASNANAGRNFFRDVNNAAFDNLSAWVPSLFGSAATWQPGARSYRISSRSLGRNLEEDLSISNNGAVDFGVGDMGDSRQGKRSAIDLVMEFGSKREAVDAALWLCDQLGIVPFSLGWRGREAGERPGGTGGDPRDDEFGPSQAREEPREKVKVRPPIKATPYAWIKPETIPMRDWIYGRYLIRQFVSATVAPGGVGKSALKIVEALAMVSGKPLLGISPPRRMRVWLWNLEDPVEETQRRIQAAALHYNLTPDDIGGRLYVDSGRDQPLVIAETTRTGTLIIRPVIESFISEVMAREIDVAVIDPFVSCHEVSENDNPAMDMVAKEWGKVAGRGNCAVEIVHHTRKVFAGETEVTTESARGAKAITDACRSVVAVNRMTKEEGERAGVENHRLYFRTFNDKANLAPPSDKSDWFHLKGVDLGNGPQNGGGGDNVGVVTTWTWPDALDGVTGSIVDALFERIKQGKWRENHQSKEWVGKAVAEVLGLDVGTRQHKGRILGLLKVWRDAGSLVVVEGKDEKGNNRSFIEVSEAAR